MSRPHHVCFLLPPDLRAGAGTRALGLVAALRRRGWLVDALGEDPLAERERQADAQVSLPAIQREAARLASHWERTRPDIIHVEVPGPEGQAWRLAAAKLGLPLTATRHRVENWLPPTVTAAERATVHSDNRDFLAACRRVLVELPGERAELAAWGLHHLAVVGNGVDAQFSPTRRSAALRAAWGATADAPVLLHVGRLLPAKGLDLLAEALSAARAANPAAVAVIVGQGPGLAELRARCPWAVFTGLLRGAELAAVYASADVFLFPSRIDNYGNVVAEALASGLACVAFDLAAAGTFLRDGRDARVVTDDAGFIDAAAQLAGDPATVRRLGAAGLTVAAGLTWEVAGAAADAALRAVLAEAPVTREPGLDALALEVHAPLPDALPAGADALLRRGHHLRWIAPGQVAPPGAPPALVVPADELAAWSSQLEARLSALAAGLTPPAAPLRIALVLSGSSGADARTRRLAGGLRRLGHLPEALPLAEAANRWRVQPPQVVHLADDAPAAAAALAGRLGLPLDRGPTGDGVDGVRYHPDHRSAELRAAWTADAAAVIVVVLVGVADAPTLATLRVLQPLARDTVVAACITAEAAHQVRAAGLRLPLVEGIPGEHLARVLASAEVVVLPGPHPVGSAVLMTLACGAVLVTEDADGGERPDPGVRTTPAGLAATVQALVDDPSRRATLAAAGRRHAEASSWTAVAARLVERLHHLLDVQR